MLHFGKNENPYHGLFVSLIILNIIPIGLYFFFKYMFDLYQPFSKVENIYSAMILGFGLSSLFNLSFCLAGLLNAPFKHVVNRIKNFFENIVILPFKYTLKAYVDDIKEHGFVFWIYLINISLYIGLAIYGCIKYYEIYTGVL